MAATKPLRSLVSRVILDMDGTLLNTDGIVVEVVKSYLVKFGKRWDNRSALKIVGTTPMEAATAIVEDYELPCSTEEFISEITPMFSEQWCNVKPLPGAARLVKHLHNHGVPMALASNSPRSNIEAKISFHNGWKENFCVIVGGDEVRMGKPSPEIFLEVARRMKVEPSNCLVIEDSPPGVIAGKAAGMGVIAVPSLRKQTSLYSSADETISSLLDLKLENWGLPPFDDWIEDTLPMEPWYIGGPVIKGFGRGSKVLGIPTANLSPEGFSDILATQASGVYFGWAGLSTKGIYKMVMSIGWNPYFDNVEKTIASFPSLESLIARIHEDRRIAENALEIPIYANYKESYLKNSL